VQTVQNNKLKDFRGAFQHPTLLSQLFHLFPSMQLIQKCRHWQKAAKESTREAIKDKELKKTAAKARNET